jgi:large subunit ribosomal protein L16
MINPTPRHFRKVNKQVIRDTYENKSNRLRFGSYGIQALEKGFLTVRQIEAVRRTITGRLKRRGKVWIRAFPDYPRTRKPKEVRMGRGKGNVDHWVCVVKPGRILFEVVSKETLTVREALV